MIEMRNQVVEDVSSKLRIESYLDFIKQNDKTEAGLQPGQEIVHGCDERAWTISKVLARYSGADPVEAPEVELLLYLHHRKLQTYR
jgi:hypothetical protein